MIILTVWLKILLGCLIVAGAGTWFFAKRELAAGTFLFHLGLMTAYAFFASFVVTFWVLIAKVVIKYLGS